MSTVTSRSQSRQYDRMIDAGVIGEHDRNELIEGRLVPKMGRTRPHVQAASDCCTRALSSIMVPGWHFAKEDTVVVSDLSKPEPELSVVRGDVDDDDDRDVSASDLALVVEIAQWGLTDDRTVMAGIYASSGIPVYWIINLIDGQIEVYSDPVRTPVDTPLMSTTSRARMFRSSSKAGKSPRSPWRIYFPDGLKVSPGLHARTCPWFTRCWILTPLRRGTAGYNLCVTLPAIPAFDPARTGVAAIESATALPRVTFIEVLSESSREPASIDAISCGCGDRVRDGGTGNGCGPGCRIPNRPDPGPSAGHGLVLRGPPGCTGPGGVDLANRALDLIDELEAQMTVYRDDSEVSRLNATAHLGPVEVEPGLFGLLERPSR